MAVGNANLQGLTTQLNLTGNKYNNALVSFLLLSHSGLVAYSPVGVILCCELNDRALCCAAVPTPSYIAIYHSRASCEVCDQSIHGAFGL